MISLIKIIILTQKSNSINFFQLIPVFAGLFGVVLGYWLKEISEDYQEEFSALQTTAELLDANPLNKHNINEFYNKLRLNLRARRLGTFNSMATTLNMVLKDEDLTKESFLVERAKIGSRLDDLKRRGSVARFKLILKDVFSQ